MKKLISVLLCTALLLSLCACGGKVLTAEALYRLVEEKTAAMEQLDTHIDMTMDMTFPTEEGEETHQVFVTGDVKGEKINTAEMRMAMPMTVLMPSVGMTMLTDIYYADGWYLMELMGQRVKCALPLEEAIEQFRQNKLQSLDFVRDLTIATDEQTGLYRLNYRLDMDKALETIGQYGGGTLSGLSEETDSIEWGDCNCTITADAEGNPTAQTMDMTFAVTGEGEAIPYALHMEYTYNPIGADFTVEIPDPESFTEVDPSLLGLAS